MSTEKKILIVSYHIPPYGGIGGRRWTKFGIHLINKGYDVQFLAAQPDNNSRERWTDDYAKIKDQVTYFRSKYPLVLKGNAASFIEKIKYRLALRKLQKSEKGNYFDHSCLDQEVIQKAVSEKVDQGYHIVISTGAPFSQLFYIAELKAEREDFKFIADFRDPWTLQDWSYGFQNIEESRKSIEKKKEAFVLNNSDKVITVLPRMTEDFKLIANEEDHISTVTNGFDEDEYAQIDLTNDNNENIKFIFAGNFYDNATHHIKDLVQSLIKLKRVKPEIYNRLQFDFYGSAPYAFMEYIKQVDCISHHGFVSSEKIAELLKVADIALLFLIDGFNYSLSTKFFEYIALEKPILLCAKEGDTSSFILKNKLGWHFQENESLDLFEKIKNLKAQGKLKIDKDFDKNQFSIHHLSQQIEELILS